MMGGRSVGGDFFGGYNDAPGFVMTVARQQVHSIMQRAHHSSDFSELLTKIGELFAEIGELFAEVGELFTEVHHLLLEPFNSGYEATELALYSAENKSLPYLKTDQSRQQQADESEKAVENVGVSGSHYHYSINVRCGNYRRQARRRQRWTLPV